jgi:hypothetical protein
MGITRHFFDCRDVDLRVKFQIYTCGPLNTALWGCITWNLSAKNRKKREVFHHGAIRCILKIRWEQVRSQRITNEQVRARFCNIPNIDAFITRRTARYLSKMVCSKEDSFPKKFLGAWIADLRKVGAPQLSCNNNFLLTVKAFLPEDLLSNNQGLFKEWIPIAKNKSVGFNIWKIISAHAKQSKAMLKTSTVMICKCPVPLSLMT